MTMTVNTKIIQADIFRATPQHLLAEVIATNHPTSRITDKLIESYVELALNKEFTADKTIYEIRKLNSFDTDYEDKIEFILDDTSRVMISIELFESVCKSINNNTMKFMRKNKENFINCIDLIKEEIDDCK